MKTFKEFIAEARKGTEQEYAQFFDEFYSLHLSSSELTRLHNTALGTERALGLKPQIEISDSGNMIVKWAERDGEVFLIGILTKSGNMTKADMPDLAKWIDRLYEKIVEGKPLITTPNEISGLLLNRIKKRLKEKHRSRQVE